MSGKCKLVITDYKLNTFIGLGAYLKKIDPLHRPWAWQLRNILIFCRAHFQRSVDRIVKPSEQPRVLHSIVMRLLDCSSDEYTEIIELLKGTLFQLLYYKLLITLGRENENIRNWAHHKNHPIIRAGLNRFCSLMDPDIYASIRNFTNAVEQAHYRSYITGIYTTLLDAIIK